MISHLTVPHLKATPLPESPLLGPLSLPQVWEKPEPQLTVLVSSCCCGERYKLCLQTTCVYFLTVLDVGSMEMGFRGRTRGSACPLWRLQGRPTPSPFPASRAAFYGSWLPPSLRPAARYLRVSLCLHIAFLFGSQVSLSLTGMLAIALRAHLDDPGSPAISRSLTESYL